MSFWTAVENPRTRPPRSWAFDIGCALFAALASFGMSEGGTTAHSFGHGISIFPKRTVVSQSPCG
jgi:hypothetical protein